MSFFAYVLRCANGSYYTGHSDDLEKRVAQHQSGEIRGYTYDKRPVELMWSAAFETRAEALSAEMQIKGWSRKKKEALIAENWERLKRASISHGDLASASLDGALRLRSGRTDGEEMPEVTATHPIIVLVRPQLGENIGKAARAMLNFGLTELRLVSPRDGWPNPDAGPAAAGADIVLERATVFETLSEAVADCQHVYATTVRKRGVTKPVVTPEEAAHEIHSATGRSAFVFGPERSGLETDDVAVARKILTVPINPEFGSLNLAQAVILCAYEWSKQASLVSPTLNDLGTPAPQEELDGMIGQLEAMLEASGYFFPPDRTPATKRQLRTVLTKPGWNSQEVRTLRGVLSALAKSRPRGMP
ncbi:rRNA methyltransferase [Sphingobium sp. SCG-1]|uniref:TrmJ/YjtD family RNA methyltransferase n=1 Tax=Sphingobium sp. SCG-1 TaxID=2072936 RepID=UPI000CD67B3B|nr:TrmJ/YjtD family RNA methyltransferase [Sphingobium sp. SCG-1]AUW58510.1 rRNA methyltransferase [Sphingobium sp. SCG-1]